MQPQMHHHIVFVVYTNVIMPPTSYTSQTAYDIRNSCQQLQAQLISGQGSAANWTLQAYKYRYNTHVGFDTHDA